MTKKTIRKQYKKAYQIARIAYNFRMQTGINYWEFIGVKPRIWCESASIDWEILWEAAQAVERLNWGHVQFNPKGNYPRLAK